MTGKKKKARKDDTGYTRIVEATPREMQEAREEEQETVFGDEYDVMQVGFKVYSKNARENLSEDFIISDLTDKERMFVRRGLKMTHHITSFLDLSRFVKERKVKIANYEFKRMQLTEDDVKRVKGERDKIVGRMLSDYNSMAILSRGKKARMIKALIQLIAGGRSSPTQEGESKLDKIGPDEDLGR